MLNRKKECNNPKTHNYVVSCRNLKKETLFCNQKGSRYNELLKGVIPLGRKLAMNKEE